MKIAICFILCLTTAVKSATGNITEFHSFEDYLEHVTSDTVRSDNADYTDDDDVDDDVTTPTSNELLSYFRTIPRNHWSCCMIGLLAGSKGFQCQPQYYSTSTDQSRRNVNRAQTDRLPPGTHGHQRGQISPRWAYGISRSFHRCVGGGVEATARDEGRANEFHKCCYAAAEERRQLRRARRYRRRHPSTRR